MNLHSYRFQPRKLLLTLLGSFLLQIVLVPIIINLISALLQLEYGQNDSLYRLIVGLLIIVGCIGTILLVLGHLERPKRLSTPAKSPLRSPGLIVIIGKQGMRGVEPDKLSHNASIEYHLDKSNPSGESLRFCWLIASEGESGSIAVAHEVKKRYEKRCHVEIRTVQDAFNVQDTYNVVRRIYREEAAGHQLKPEQILADFTGGTTPMSVGLALAAQEYSMQYMYGGRPDIKTEPVAIEIRLEEDYD